MANNVLIFGMDGLQPAQITPEQMPNLSALADGGVNFQNHHSVYPTVTRVNVASITTGRVPGAHGIVGNSMLVRDLDRHKPIVALMPDLVRLREKTGSVLLTPSLAELLSTSGKNLIAVGCGSTGNSFLWNSNPDLWGGATIHPDFSLPNDLHGEVLDKFGSWPSVSVPDTARIDHAVSILTDYVLADRDASVVVFWSSDPDRTQHEAGVGSDQGTRALSGVDRQLGRVLDRLEKSGRKADTDVIIVSDHGYSTIKGLVDVETQIRDAGFPMGDLPGGVVVADNGGTMLFYVPEHDTATADLLAHWLMSQWWCGSIVASKSIGEIEGVLSANSVGVEGVRAADLTMSFSWSSEPNSAGYKGHVYNMSGGLGLGTHGSMGRTEQRNVMIASGPSFKSGVVVQTPTGNIDLAPTTLRLLGLDCDIEMDGRVLEEALIDGPDPSTIGSINDLLRAERSIDAGVYRQEVSVSRIGSTTYVNHGNRQ